jgi:hypothetical protein
VLRDVSVSFEQADARPPFALYDVSDVSFLHVAAERTPGVPFCLMRDVKRFLLRDSPRLGGIWLERVARDVVR